MEWAAIGALMLGVGVLFFMGCRLSYVQGHIHGYEEGRYDSDEEYRAGRHRHSSIRK